MNATTTICPYCRKPFEISDAIRRQIEDELLRAKTEQSEILRKEYDAKSEARLKQAVQNAVAEARHEAELRLAKERQTAKLEADKAKQSTELEIEKAKRTTELETERLRSEAASSKESEKRLRKQLSDLLEELSKANKAREDAELSARKELLEKEKGIREDAAERASEDFNTKIREQEETINKLREQLTAAKQVAEQGSQQLQGEILELDVERNLRVAFPFDTVEEVKKGERGSDMRQIVNERFYSNCGLILWECKNAKTYQASWLSKLKDELVTEKAQIGAIVFNPTDGGGDDFKQLADNVWLVKPRYAVMLATFLREVLVKVFVANRKAEGKEVKIEMMYNYLTGGEFSNRIRYIIESYDEMAKQLDAEKKQAQKRWAAQEKILQKVTSGLYGMSGDLQGIAGQEIITLPAIDEDSDDGFHQ
ncbi:MAG: DUF2130 domain-containing protein [Clostridiales bacterium]|jgi:hypothetical protein|nr:DUF2130 domain-containing protein [Clostridiales bacterium]